MPNGVHNNSPSFVSGLQGTNNFHFLRLHSACHIDVFQDMVFLRHLLMDSHHSIATNFQMDTTSNSYRPACSYQYNTYPTSRCNPCSTKHIWFHYDIRTGCLADIWYCQPYALARSEELVVYTV
ncbi:hypothetical protein CHS0354_043174, partial [Potamilus streckersoni]